MADVHIVVVGSVHLLASLAGAGLRMLI